MASKRAMVLGEQLRQILSTALIYEMRDSALAGVLITDVSVSSDLGYADIRIQASDDERQDRQMLAALHRAGGAFKRILSSQVRLRKLPELRFHIDNTQKAERRIQDILNTLDIQPEEETDGNAS